MGRVVAIANVKGGVGKTTTAVNLGACLVERGRRVLAVDLDPQASLTLSLGLDPSLQTKTIYNALSREGTPLSSLIQSSVEGIDLVPANRQLGRFADGADDGAAQVRALRSVLEPIRDSYDYILIDCPANAGILTGNALTAANEVLIPLTADHLTFQAFTWFLSLIARVRETCPNLRIVGAFFNMLDTRTRHARKIMSTAQQMYGSKVPFFATSIRFSVCLRDASADSQSILRYAPDSTSADEYRNLAREVEEGLKAAPANEVYLTLVHGDRAAEQHDLATAYADYCRATELNPQLAGAWMNRGECAVDWDEKVRCFGQAVRLEPENASAQASLSKTVADSAALTAVTGIHALITSAHYLETIGQCGMAAKIYARITELDPRSEEAWLGRGRTSLSPEEAIGYLQRCLEVNPGNEQAQGELQAARERVKKAAMQLVERGVNEARNGNAEKARALFQEASEMDPQNDLAWLSLARSTTDFQTAFGYVKKALEINPANAPARELYHFLDNPQEPGMPRILLWLRLFLLLLILIVVVVAALVLTGQLRFG